jgi:hexosaminidase
MENSRPCLRRLRMAAVTAIGFFASILAARPADSATSMDNDLMPVPAQIRFSPGRLRVTEGFTVAVGGYDDARLQAAVSRALGRWKERTALRLDRPAAANAAATLAIDCRGPGHVTPSLDEDESYALEITTRQATLRAPTVVGALRGLETLLQLLSRDADGFFLPAVSIRDQPRFSWRGLMIDVARHWQPIEVIKRNLDGMALVKLNVLHLHLTDDQGFRVESRTHPELQSSGSDGHYFTQNQIREIIAYAKARGIRVVPEFDLPGHATSWVVSHPELASLPGPYAIERRWGVFNPVLDPTDESLYRLLDDFLGEMAQLFPDACIHIGGDENNGVQWNANPHIQAFIREHGLNDNAGLHAWFNRRVSAILAHHGKTLIGWDEVLHPDLPKDAIIHSWRGPESLASAARQGYRGILSNGYYIDLVHPASEHYLNDPLPATTTLTIEEQRRVLGGEATMWSEWVTPETVDSRIWPRTAAIAERLWSPREVRAVEDMYRRLAVVSVRLEEAGLGGERHHDLMVARLAGDRATPDDVQALRTLVDVVEPVKDYHRGGLQPDVVQSTPLTNLADCARPDSAAARNFAESVNRFLFQPGTLDRDQAAGIIRQLGVWNAAGRRVAAFPAGTAPTLNDIAHNGRALADFSAVGQEAMQALLSGHAPDEQWMKTRLVRLHQAGEPGPAAVEFPILPSLELLVTAAAEQEKRGALAPDAWQQHLRAIAFPSAPPPI